LVDEEDDGAYEEEEEFDGEDEGEEEELSDGMEQDDLNSEERAELEELQNQGFNPMQTLGRLIAGLDGTKVPEEGEEHNFLQNIPGLQSEPENQLKANLENS